MSLQTSKDIFDVVDCEHDATYAQCVGWCVLPGADRRRRVKLRQFEAAVAIWRPHHGDVDSDIVESDDPVHPRPLNWGLALQLQSEFEEERNSSLKIADNDADVVHPLDRHRHQRSHQHPAELPNSGHESEQVPPFAGTVGCFGPSERRLEAVHECRSASVLAALWLR